MHQSAELTFKSRSRLRISSFKSRSFGLGIAAKDSDVLLPEYAEHNDEFCLSLCSA